MQKASHYTRGEGEVAICNLCPHFCRIDSGNKGRCGARLNRNGELYSYTYGKISALNIDPIEKKPIYHFMPGKRILSIGSLGCNLTCSFCQNHHISQVSHGIDSYQYYTPQEILERASLVNNNAGIAYTYNEPLVGFEFMMDTAILAKNNGLKNVVVSNGYVNPGPLEQLLDVADAFNIDLKAFTNKFYKEVTDGTLKPVLNTIKAIARKGIHLEITFLVIPGLNNHVDEFKNMLRWIRDEAGDLTPLHINRSFPHFRLLLEPTPEYTIKEFTDMARDYLTFVYPGNLNLDDSARNTYCYGCGCLIVSRQGYQSTVLNATEDGDCMNCKFNIFKN